MKKNIIYIGLGGLAIYYLFFRKKSTGMKVPTGGGTIPAGNASIVTTSMPKQAVYPLGIGMDGSTFPLNEGDYVANGVETAILYQGKLHPVTARYVDKYGPNSWARTKVLDNIVYSSIPRGEVLDA